MALVKPSIYIFHPGDLIPGITHVSRAVKVGDSLKCFLSFTKMDFYDKSYSIWTAMFRIRNEGWCSSNLARGSKQQELKCPRICCNSWFPSARTHVLCSLGQIRRWAIIRRKATWINQNYHCDDLESPPWSVVLSISVLKVLSGPKELNQKFSKKII